MATPATIHASCVSVGGRGVLIRGASGAGKSHLAFALILAGGSGIVPPTLLVADDRVILTPSGHDLLAAAPHTLAGLIEVRGVGVRLVPYGASVPVRLVADLGAADADRLPAPEACRCVISGVELPRLPVLASGDAVQQVLARLLTEPGVD